MPKLKLSKKQVPKSDNNCDTCKNPLIIQIEYNLKDYNATLSKGCLHCGFMDNSTLDITKEDIDFHIEQLLNKNICGICNKDITTINIKVCEKALVIFTCTICPHCKTHYIIVKPCDNEEELESFNFNRK